jgi:SET domain
MEVEDDPFDAFGEDGDDDGEDQEEPESIHHGVTLSSATAAVAKSLVDAANQRIKCFATEGSSITKNRQPLTAAADQQEQQQPSPPPNLPTHLQLLDVPWPEPLYVGPILLVSSLPVGGGRGYVASRDLPPGTLILVEEPMMKWPEDQLGKRLGLASIRYVLERPDAGQLLHDFESFHPTKENVDRFRCLDSDYEDVANDPNREQVVEMMKILEKEYSHPTSPHPTSQESGDEEHCRNQQERRQLDDLKDLARARGIDLSTADILRLVLALRYNGLESGVYRHVAMLNHDDDFNCAKLLPQDGQPYSEVRTTRPVAAGESLTISYLPRVISHASRRRYLWEQHRFDIGTSQVRGGRWKMEIVGNSLPPSSIHGGWDEESVTFPIETATEELEKMLTEIEAGLSGGESPDGFEIAKALEQAAWELYVESMERLNNPNHVILVPILSLHLEACALVLKDSSISNAIRLGVLSRQANSAYHLIPIKHDLLGVDHFDLGRTNLDLANVVSELLSRSPRKLYDLNLQSMGSFSDWSALENKARKEYNRIKDLYPHDAESLMASSKQREARKLDRAR